jgi:hypothetical protein
MTKSGSPPIKQDAPVTAFNAPPPAAIQEADDVIKQGDDELAALTPDAKEANARTQRFVQTLGPDDRSKFYNMIGNEEFFRMFTEYATKQQSPTEQAEDDSIDNENDSPSDDNIRYRDASDAEKARLYEEFIADQQKQDKATKYSSRKIPAFQNKWGLQISPAARSDHELGVVKIILRKHDRGDDPSARKKTRDKVVKALTTKISAGNLSRLLTSVAADEYDVAEDAISWQTILNSIRTFILQYDMTSLIMIPQDVDLSNPTQVAKATKFKDAIVDWRDLQDSDYFEWQHFVLRNSTDVEIESDNWLDEVLTLSMDKTLRAEVESDIISIPKHQRGAIATLRCIIKRMVVRNQEARDALGNYIKEFDITKFPGENVPTACLRLKAVSRALGEKELPTNTIRRVLEGFGKSSTPSFNEFCTSQIAMRRGSFYEKLVQSSSLQTQLNEVLNDLEATYLDLVGGKLWAGVNASPTKAAFVGDQTIDDKLEEARALALQKKLPFAEWEKLYAECHECGKKGHIRPNCPIYLEKVKTGQVKPPVHRRKPPGLPKPRRDFSKDPKAKAFWVAAFNAMFGDDTEEDKDDNSSADANNNHEDKQHEENADEDMRSFLSMVGSLKE